MIYLHVPFCRSFCTYCDFYSEIACKGKDEEAIARWAEDVCREIEERRQEIESTLDLNTLYIGGGTPSVLPLSVLKRIISTLTGVTFAPLPLLSGAPPLKYPAAPELPISPQSGSIPLSAGHAEACLLPTHYTEFTIEVNPEDVVERGEDYVRGLMELGVTRISMGVQSLDDGILRWMNRRHDSTACRKAFQLLHGSADISIDLITGVPGMTMEILERTVEEVVGWRPEHISAYQLSVEEGSALARMIERGEVKELDEEACRDQYDYLCRRLAEAGYHHYEISNWALPGHEAVHNSAYWTRHPYVGLGPGAHSLCGGAAPKSPAAPELPTSPQNGSVPLSAVRSEERIEKPSRRSWNSQTLSGWTSEGEDLTQEQIHEEEVMLLARTDRGPIPEQDWFIADEIIPDLL